MIYYYIMKLPHTLVAEAARRAVGTVLSATGEKHDLLEERVVRSGLVGRGGSPSLAPRDHGSSYPVLPQRGRDSGRIDESLRAPVCTAAPGKARGRYGFLSLSWPSLRGFRKVCVQPQWESAGPGGRAAGNLSAGRAVRGVVDMAGGFQPGRSGAHPGFGLP